MSGNVAKMSTAEKLHASLARHLTARMVESLARAPSLRPRFSIAWVIAFVLALAVHLLTLALVGLAVFSFFAGGLAGVLLAAFLLLIVWILRPRLQPADLSRLQRERFPAFDLPIVCLPASIDNNLPGSELAVGSDTALNNIVGAVDKIKTTAVASQRCFVVEVMGRRCGYLALLSAFATGAERVYMNEDGVTLADLQRDLERLKQRFRAGKRLGLLIRNEEANPFYTTPFLCALFEQEGGGLFDVRQAILGHLQQGGDPSPFDRILATWLAALSVDYLVTRAEQERSGAAAFVGIREGKLKVTPFAELSELMDLENQRPREQWWRKLAPVVELLAVPGPEGG